MSRRHNASRRRNYTRRQHEVRERRPETDAADWAGRIDTADWNGTDDFAFETPPPRSRDRLSGAHS
jgi:hypothetical protein